MAVGRVMKRLRKRMKKKAKSKTLNTEKKYVSVGRFRVERNAILLIIVIEIFGLMLAVSDYIEGEREFDGELVRAPYEERDTEEKLVVTDNAGEERQVTVHVSKQVLSEEKARKLIARAEKEIDGSVKGENPSLDKVTKPLTVKEEYCDGFVEAAWSFSEPTYIGRDGTVFLEKLNEPVTMLAEITLSCSGYESVYSFPLKIIIPEVKSREGFGYYLKKALSEADGKGKEHGIFHLPETVGDTPVQWKRQRNFRGQELMGMGVVAAVAIILGQGEEKRRERLRRNEALETDYPELVSTLSLYVSAGISVKSAFSRIALRYKAKMPDQRGSPHPGYDAIVIAVREMEDGISETQAYRKFGARCDHRLYGKLAMMLAQNVKKGNRQLKEQLEKEEAESFEARKVRARILGEEASTKLLLPMGMMLAVVLIVTIAPAMMNMGF